MDETEFTPGQRSLVALPNDEWMVIAWPDFDGPYPPVGHCAEHVGVFDRQSDAELDAAAPQLYEQCKRAVSLIERILLSATVPGQQAPILDELIRFNTETFAVCQEAKGGIR